MQHNSEHLDLLVSYSPENLITVICPFLRKTEHEGQDGAICIAPFYCRLRLSFDGFILIGCEGTREGEKEDEEEKYENADDNKISSGENLKSPSSIMALQRLQKLFSAYKDELEEEEAQMDIGLPMDVKHVTHIGLDGFASAVHTRGWNSQPESESIDPYQFLLKPLESPVTKNADEQGIMRLLETKLRDYQGPKIDTKEMGHPK